MSKEIFNIINDMTDMLSPVQLKRLQEVLVWRLSEEEKHKVDYSNEEYLNLFLAAKKLEGCSDRTVEFYRYTITKVFDKLDIPIIKISTEHLRKYLVEYQQEHNCSKTTIDNIRRNISSFFSWLEEEDYIIKSPVKRIHKVKTTQRVKSVITDECIERLRDGCNEIRDLAMFDFLLSTGIRVGELVKIALYVFNSPYRNTDLERLLNYAGDECIDANWLITLLEAPDICRNYDSVRELIRQCSKASEWAMKKRLAEELILGEWFITADYGGHETKFQLVPVEELNEIRALLGVEPKDFEYVLDEPKKADAPVKDVLVKKGSFIKTVPVESDEEIEEALASCGEVSK